MTTLQQTSRRPQAPEPGCDGVDVKAQAASTPSSPLSATVRGNCVPQVCMFKSKSRASEGGLVWRQGVYRGDQVHTRSLAGTPNST